MKEKEGFTTLEVEVVYKTFLKIKIMNELLLAIWVATKAGIKVEFNNSRDNGIVVSLTKKTTDVGTSGCATIITDKELNNSTALKAIEDGLKHFELTANQRMFGEEQI